MHELEDVREAARSRGVRIKRVYDKPEPDDGFRVLVDRLWPRGLTKQKARLDAWLRDVAPSPALRKWYSHDPARWTGFQKRYREELKAHRAELAELRKRAASGPVTLLYAARTEHLNHAVVLKELIERAPRRRATR